MSGVPVTPPDLPLAEIPAAAAAPIYGASLFDPTALMIVLAGTLVATFARAGVCDARLAIGAALALMRKGVDEDANRKAFARWAHSIRQRGVLGADSALPPDADLARALKALVRSGSIAAFRRAHEDAGADKLRERARAVRVFEQAGELAPVFGLVGTLFSMTQVAPAVAPGAEASALSLGVIAGAVLSTLYGVLCAHFVFLPLAHAIARRAEREETLREELATWLANEIEGGSPRGAAPGGGAPRVTNIKRAA